MHDFVKNGRSKHGLEEHDQRIFADIRFKTEFFELEEELFRSTLSLMDGPKLPSRFFYEMGVSKRFSEANYYYGTFLKVPFNSTPGLPLKNASEKRLETPIL